MSELLSDDVAMLRCADWGRSAAAQSVGVDQCSADEYGGDNALQGE